MKGEGLIGWPGLVKRTRCVGFQEKLEAKKKLTNYFLHSNSSVNMAAGLTMSHTPHSKIRRTRQELYSNFLKFPLKSHKERSVLETV